MRGEVLEPTDVVSFLLPGVLLGLCLVSCLGCSVQRVRRRRRAQQNSGTKELEEENATVQIIPADTEAEERRERKTWPWC